MFLDRVPVRFRLSLAHAIWMAILFLGTGIGLYRSVEIHLLDSVDAALLSSAKSVRDAEFSRKFSRSKVEVFFEHFFKDRIVLDQFLGHRYVKPYAQLIDLSGKVQSKTSNIRASLPVTPIAVSRAERGLETFEIFRSKDRAPLRQITLPVFRNGKFTNELIQVGASLSDIYQSLDQIFLVLWIALPLGLLISILFGYLLTERSFKPVRDISKAASQLGIDDLSIRLPLPKANDELRELSVTFNAMLDRLEESVNRLRRFTGDVSHELRTPLAVMRGEAELALRREREGKEYKTTLKTITKEAIHMTGIIEDLLLLARAESKNVAMNPIGITAIDFVNELKDISNPVYADKGVHLDCKIEANIEFTASRKLLLLAIKNILVNAAKHSPKNSIVEFQIFKYQNEIVFEITDHGEGIPKESLPLIFDSFYRADTARNRSAGGVGIGLSLALALVKLHNGNIKVSSEVGKGSEFRINIPLDKNPIEVDRTKSKNPIHLAKNKLSTLKHQKS